MAAGNETNNFVRDGSMLPHHDIDTSTTPNSWKPIYPYVVRYGSSSVRYYADGTCDMWGVVSAQTLPINGTAFRDLDLPIAVTNAYPEMMFTFGQLASEASADSTGGSFNSVGIRFNDASASGMGFVLHLRNNNDAPSSSATTWHLNGATPA